MELATYCEGKALIDLRAGSLVDYGRQGEIDYEAEAICPEKSIHLLVPSGRNLTRTQRYENPGPTKWYTVCGGHSQAIRKNWRGWAAISLTTNTVIWHKFSRGRGLVARHS